MRALNKHVLHGALALASHEWACSVQYTAFPQAHFQLFNVASYNTEKLGIGLGETRHPVLALITADSLVPRLDSDHSTADQSSSSQYPQPIIIALACACAYTYAHVEDQDEGYRIVQDFDQLESYIIKNCSHWSIYSLKSCAFLWVLFFPLIGFPALVCAISVQFYIAI